MGDSEIKKEEVKQSEKKESAKSGKKKGGFFKSLKAEFQRIIWPDKDKIVKETTAVVIVSVILGAVIALLDFAIKMGLDKVLQIG